MNYSKKQALEIIKALYESDSYCDCPCGCGDEIRLRDAELFYLDDFNEKGREAYEELLRDLKQQRIDLKVRERKMKERPQLTAKAVNIGFILERIAPAFDQFPFERNDCRSLFDPIDYVIFEGMKKKGEVSRIIFTDIKTGAAKLNGHQKQIKSLIEDKKIEFKLY